MLASQRAAVLEAPRSDSANTEAPLASGDRKASAWIDTNRSACTRRAFCTRTFSGTKKSASRVIIARMLGWASILARSRCAIWSTTSFSREPAAPMAPGSSPPWPGSRATVSRRRILNWLGGGTLVWAIGGGTGGAEGAEGDEGLGLTCATAGGGAVVAGGSWSLSSNLRTSAPIASSSAPGGAPATPSLPAGGGFWAKRRCLSSVSRTSFQSGSGGFTG
ncbi:hypothetical protein D3C81_1543770 [compost metagenome]